MKTIESLKAKPAFRLLYWCIRAGMGLTFVVSGLRKMSGIRFTALPVENPVGAYFNAMYETGLYWNFIGYFQIAVGLAVFLNRFVVVSSLLMMPVTLNIFFVSLALHMRGTPVITTAMVLGNLFLLIWHYKNYRTLWMKPM